MNMFSADYASLEQDFVSRGIPIDSPGFYDDPNFLSAEHDNPAYLNNYAAFVAKRSYTAEYLLAAKQKIDIAASLLHRELAGHGRLGACIDISQILSRILDKEGIWNCCIKGSLTITFPIESHIDPKYFRSVDVGNFFAGHAWLFAPPYTVVDISVKQQPYESNALPYLPNTVLTTESSPMPFDVNDIVSPSVRQCFLDEGIPPELYLPQVATFIPDIFNSFPVISAAGLQGSILKYSPYAAFASDLPLEKITNMIFNGLTPWELYRKKFMGRLTK